MKKTLKKQSNLTGSGLALLSTTEKLALAFLGFMLLTFKYALPLIYKFPQSMESWQQNALTLFFMGFILSALATTITARSQNQKPKARVKLTQFSPALFTVIWVQTFSAACFAISAYLNFNHFHLPLVSLLAFISTIGALVKTYRFTRTKTTTEIIHA